MALSGPGRRDGESRSSADAGATEPPSALARLDALRARWSETPLAVFLDFDGTLAPIVDRPERAALAEGMRPVLERLARLCPVAVISGRDRADVAGRVGVDGLVYAGSHGLDVSGSPALDAIGARWEAYLPALDSAERAARDAAAGVPGAVIDRKRYGLAIHYRTVAPDDRAAIAELARGLAAAHGSLRLAGGKMVWELRPDVDWHKGRAVEAILEGLAPPPHHPLFLGDDVTDEDAFEAIRGTGTGIVVMEEPRQTAAEFRLADPEEVRRFLSRLADAPRAG